MADLRCRRRGQVRAKTAGLILAALLLADSAGAAIAQATPRPDLSGRWLLNRALSENAEAKLEAARAAQSGIHGMLGSMLGGRRAEMEEMLRLVLHAPPSLIVRQNANRIVLSDGEGPPRTLVADGRSVNIDGREVLARWDGARAFLRHHDRRRQGHGDLPAPERRAIDRHHERRHWARTPGQRAAYL
jgi:hypothetical protein